MLAVRIADTRDFMKKLLTQELLNQDSTGGPGIVGWLRKRLTSEGRNNEEK